jgi:hypothetical protein
MKVFAYAFLISLSMPLFAQENSDCDVPVTAIKTAGKATLADATRVSMAAITSAKCQILSSADENDKKVADTIKMTTAEFDFQTAQEADGTLEVLFIVGLAGELDKTVTTDTDFTYSVPDPKKSAATDYALRLPKKISPEQALANAIVNAERQLIKTPSFGPDLTDAKVAVTITYAFKKDGTLELEPKFGSVSITGKVIFTKTTTQKVVITFEKKK